MVPLRDSSDPETPPIVSDTCWADRKLVAVSWTLEIPLNKYNFVNSIVTKPTSHSIAVARGEQCAVQVFAALVFVDSFDGDASGLNCDFRR